MKQMTREQFENLQVGDELYIVNVCFEDEEELGYRLEFRKTTITKFPERPLTGAEPGARWIRMKAENERPYDVVALEDDYDLSPVEAVKTELRRTEKILERFERAKSYFLDYLKKEGENTK